MNNNQLAEAAKILGVSEDSISAMDDEIKNGIFFLDKIRKRKRIFSKY